MSPISSAASQRRWQLLAVTLAALLLTTAGPQPVQSEPTKTDREDRQTLLWIDYLEASLRLAEADLKIAELSNARVHGSVTEYDLKRIELQRRFIEYARSQMNQGRDFGEIFAAYAKLHAILADLDVQSAAEARASNPSSVSDAQFERTQRAAEMARLYAQIARDLGESESPLEHIEHATHRLTAEVMQLNRRVSHLEELIQR